ncbi:MAG: RHS repeat protein [Deltaproteobacteria bacterium]|nr:RHS repeat protein [Deltaproteobacteria bacterium]MDQ3298310.1 RHS repeat protein [Myxococcota bacterium]
MRWLWVFLVACSAPAKPATVPAVVGNQMAQPYCPPLDHAEVGYWASELFPACQDAPFGFPVTLCNGARCARPCLQTLGSSGGEESWKLAYTDDGKLETSRSTKGLFDTECFWDRGKLTRCTEGAHSFKVTRDARGRITTIVSDDATTEIRYDPRGRVIEVGARAIAYDDAGRITRVGTTAIEWDAKGRVVRERDPDATRTLAYDDRDRVVAVTLQDDGFPAAPPLPPEPPAAPSSPSQGGVIDHETMGDSVRIVAAPPGVRITYDQSRVSSISVSDGSVWGDRTMTFGYDCQSGSR